MNKSQSTSRQNGLTLLQWGLLVIAFMIGVGGTFILREVVSTASAHAGVVQTNSPHSDSAK